MARESVVARGEGLDLRCCALIGKGIEQPRQAQSCEGMADLGSGLSGYGGDAKGGAGNSNGYAWQGHVKQWNGIEETGCAKAWFRIELRGEGKETSRQETQRSSKSKV